jgi:acetyl-coenzyme A synthetase (EC 6.2.1.1)
MTPDNIKSMQQEQRLFTPPAATRAHIPDMATYEEHYRRADQDPDGYWGDRAKELISWAKPFDKVMDCDLRVPKINWFVNGQLNVSYNCLDRHVENGNGDKTAIIWQGEPEDDVRHISYRELLADVVRSPTSSRSWACSAATAWPCTCPWCRSWPWPCWPARASARPIP